MNIGSCFNFMSFFHVFFACLRFFHPPGAPHPAVARSRRDTWPQRTTRKPSVTLILCTSNSQSPLPRISRGKTTATMKGEGQNHGDKLRRMMGLPFGKLA